MALLTPRASWGMMSRRLDRLQWKLTLSYTMVTVAVMTLLVALSLALLVFEFSGGRRVATPALNEAMTSLAPQAGVFLKSYAPDRAGLQVWVNKVVQDKEMHIVGERDLRIAFPSKPLLVIVDREGMTMASTSATAAPPGMVLSRLLAPRSADLLRSALGGDSMFFIAIDAPTTEVAATPVLGEDGEVVGAVYLAHTWPTPLEEFVQGIVGVLIANALPIVAVAAVVGSLLGLPTARWLSGRLRRLSAATHAWGAGDFSVVVHDSSRDEIGQLARELNKMVGQVQALLHDRERLAALEERNRLARDLHDSVTQALYSVSLHAEAAARRLQGGETALATEYLRDLQAMSHDALREMRLLIFELRPPVLEQEGLAAALQARLEAVEDRAGLTTTLQIDDERLSPAIEEGFYLLAREALNNVLKHAEARHVAVTLRREGRLIALEVRDDGVGFDPAAVGGGLGLGGMRERAARFGGRLTIESQPGAGALVRVEVAA